MPTRRTLITLAAVIALAAAGFWFARSWAPRSAALDLPAAQAAPAHPKVVELVDGGTPGVGDSTYKRQLALIQTLPAPLEPADGDALLNYILGPRPAGVTPEEWHHIVNNLLNQLRAAGPNPHLTGALVTLFRNEAADPVLRDYAIQHLRAWHADEGPDDFRETDPEKRALILETLRAAARTPGQNFQGTALIALDHIDRKYPAEHLAAEVSQLALALAANSEFKTQNSKFPPIPVRITALQICAERNLAAALPEARRLTADPATDAALRTAAIAAIGKLGAAEDRAMLAGLRADATPRIGQVLDAAARRLDQKLSLNR